MRGWGAASSAADTWGASFNAANTAAFHILAPYAATVLQVIAMHTVETSLYPAFVASTCFRLYSKMQHFSHTRVSLSKTSFKWLKV